MKLNLKQIAAAGVAFFALGATCSTNAAESVSPTLSAPSVSLPEAPKVTPEMLSGISRDPVNLGRMMATFVGSLPKLVLMCEWEEKPAKALSDKATRVVDLYYGGMNLDMRVPFAQGYFEMEEKFVDGLNQSSAEELNAVCERIQRDEREMHKALDSYLEPLEKAVKAGTLKPQSIYEGRGLPAK